MKIGFQTGTFDCLHEGHYSILKYCKDHCDYLIVGLTSDELAEKQKRKPFLNFNHRKTQLIHTPYVDHVIEHRGQSKQDMYKDLHFHVLFIVDEYKESKEYTSFIEEYPDVPVHFYPRIGDSSSTMNQSLISFKLLRNLEVLASGISGSIMSYKSVHEHIVIKPVHIGFSEYNTETKNAYHLPFPNLPRNWKNKRETFKYPNISGVNSYREIRIQQFIRDFNWNPVYEIHHKYTYPCITGKTPVSEDWSHISIERLRPKEIYWIHQLYAGQSLYTWMKTKYNKDDLEKIKNSITHICGDLKESGIVHGDIHSYNICISDDLKVSLIDFGWCMHWSFEMCDDERKYYKECLQQDFDLNHFNDSFNLMFNETEMQI